MTHNRVMLGYVVGTKLPKSHWLIEIKGFFLIHVKFTADGAAVLSACLSNYGSENQTPITSKVRQRYLTRNVRFLKSPWQRREGQRKHTVSSWKQDSFSPRKVSAHMFCLKYLARLPKLPEEKNSAIQLLKAALCLSHRILALQFSEELKSTVYFLTIILFTVQSICKVLNQRGNCSDLWRMKEIHIFKISNFRI